MTDTKQPEALEIADLLESFANAVGEHPSGSRARAAAELRRQQTEIDRLTKHLHGANSQAEEFERKWYLRGDEVEAKDARIAELEAENRELKAQQEAVGAGGVTGLRCGDTKDAKRYRWLRDQADYLRLPEGSPQVCLTDEWGGLISTGKETYPQGEALDAAIDSAAAIAQEGGK